MTVERRRYSLHEAAHVVGCILLGAKIRHAAAPGGDGENQVVHEAVPDDDGSGNMLISLMGVAAEQVYGYRERVARGVIWPSKLTGCDRDLRNAYDRALSMVGPQRADDLYVQTWKRARSFVIDYMVGLERLADLLEAHAEVDGHQIHAVARLEGDAYG